MNQKWLRIIFVWCLALVILPVAVSAQNLNIYVDDAIAYYEGDSGTTATVTITVRVVYSGTFRTFAVDYQTQDVAGGATAGSDYTARSGTLYFPYPGLIKTLTFNVTILGDDLTEPDELFNIVLSNARYTGYIGSRPPLVIADGTANVLIVDDEYAPYQISAAALAGNIEGTSPSVVPGLDPGYLTISLDRPVAQYHQVRVSWVTGTGTATPVVDYVPVLDLSPVIPAPVVTFSTGEQTKTITVQMSTDHHVESDETIPINLFNASPNAVINVAQGILGILDDDQADIAASKTLYTMDNIPITSGELVAGEMYKYIGTLVNNGPGNLWSTTGDVVTVIDVLPVGLNFVSCSGGGTYDAATHTITWLVSLAMSWDFMATYTAEVVVTVDPLLYEGTSLTNQLCATFPNFTYFAGHDWAPDPDLGNCCVAPTATVVLPDVDFCSQFDSDRNVGLAPLQVNFHSFKKVLDPHWYMGDGLNLHQADNTHTYMTPCTQNDDYKVGYMGSFMPHFVTVYTPAPDAYASLQVVSSSPSNPKQDWSNAVDGDTYWKNGTAAVTHDATGKPWAIFEFVDQTTKNLSKLRLLTDTGLMNGDHQMRHFRVLVSTTGTEEADFTEILAAEKSPILDTPCELNDDWQAFSFTPMPAKYIKLVIDTPETHWRYLGEFEAYVHTVLPDANKSWIAASCNGTAVDVTLHLFDAENNPLAGKQPDDIHFFAMPMHHENPNPQGTWSAWTETAPGVYSAQLTCPVEGEKQILASVDGVLVLHTNPDAEEMCTVMIGTEKVSENMLPIDPSLPANALVFVKGSVTAKNQGWDNAVDGDFDGWDGTTTARGSKVDAGPAWGIFQFAGQGLMQFDRVVIQTDNGTDDDRYEMRQAIKIEILISTTGTADGDFTSIKTLYRTNGKMKCDLLKEMVSARYVKVMLHEPVWQTGAWRQIVEFQVHTSARHGAMPVGEAAALEALPQTFQLEQNYPNPFNPVTSLRYQLPQDVHVTLAIFDISGQQVARLVDENQSAGWHSVKWNAAGMPSGVYFARMVAGEFSDVKQMMLVK